MTTLVTGFHGTKDLQGILEAGAILQKYYLQQGEEYWKEQKSKYDALSSEFASRLRAMERGPDLIENARKNYHPNMPPDEFAKNDEILANILINSLRVQDPERKIYDELNIGLTICFARNLKEALPYEGFNKDKVGAILQLEFEPIPSIYYSVIKYMGKLDIKYVQKIFTWIDNLEGVRRLVQKYDLDKNLISEWTDPYNL